MSRLASARNVAASSGLMHPRPLARRAGRRAKAKSPDCALSTSEVSAAYLHEGPPSCCRYRVCYLHELTSDHALAASTRMQSHSPRNCNFACIATLLTLLSSGRAPAAVRCALYTGLRHVLYLLYLSRQQVLWAAFSITSRPRPQIGLLSGFCQRLLASVESPGEICTRGQDSRPFP